MQETEGTQIWSLGWEDSLEESMETHSSILASRRHGQRNLVGYSPQGHKESDTTEATEHVYGERSQATFFRDRSFGVIWNILEII